MKILLINPPNGLFDKTYLAPPLGLLTLASFLKKNNFDVEVIDLNLTMFEHKSLDNRDAYQEFGWLINNRNPDIVGFTSMCLESHVSLELAKQLKEKNSKIKTVFGGTHFGAIANELLANFNFVDFVISGEGESAFLSILDTLKSDVVVLPENVTYRRNEKIEKGILETKVLPLEEIPFPAYDLVDLERYFKLNSSNLLNYEAGRGCVFKCSFCYSPFHYGDNVRHKSADYVVGELNQLVDLGAKRVFFVQDNFLNSPRWATEVCQKIAEVDLPLIWECYSTFPQLNENVVNLLAKAKCKGVFTGIDAVSISSQKRMNKPFLKSWTKTSDKLSNCINQGITPICAFILEEPNQDIEKIESAIYIAIECVRLGCEVHLNTLSLYNGTDLAKNLTGLEYRYSDIKPDLLLDTPKIVQHNSLAKVLPELFPYHSTCCNVKDWEIFTAKAHLILPLIYGLTDTLYQFVVNEGKSIWKALDFIDGSYVKWVRDVKPLERHEAVIFAFAMQFGKMKLSKETSNYFHRDIAKVFLSSRKSTRFVNLSINGDDFKAALPWFVNLKQFGKLESESYDQPVAFLTKEKTVKFYVVPTEHWQILARLEAATISGEIQLLSNDERAFLLENNWISLKENASADFG